MKEGEGEQSLREGKNVFINHSTTEKQLQLELTGAEQLRVHVYFWYLRW